MAVENFLTYLENDPNTKITVTSNKIDVENEAWNAESYVRGDKGVGHFGDFEHLVDVYIDSGMGANVWTGGWAMSNGSNTYTEMDAANEGLYLLCQKTEVGSSRFLIRDLTNDNSDDGTVGADDTWFYLKIKRSGTTLTVEIYSDSARTAWVDTLTIVCSTDFYRYVFGFSNRESGTNIVYLEVMNLDLQEVVVAGGGLTLTLNPSPKGGIGRPPLLTGGSSFGG